MNVVEAEKKMNELLDSIDDTIQQAKNIAREFGFSFVFNTTTGFYDGPLTKDQALSYIESGDYEKLSRDMKDRIDYLLKDDISSYSEEDGMWESSNC